MLFVAFSVLGDYNYKYLCMPTPNPWSKNRTSGTFYPRDAWLGIMTAAVMGLQHSLAMVRPLVLVHVEVHGRVTAPGSGGDVKLWIAEETARFILLHLPFFLLSIIVN